MSISLLLQRYLDQLPEQVDLLREAYEKLSEGKERERLLSELRSYERRMERGLEFLLNVDGKTMDMMEGIREPSAQLLEHNKHRYKDSLLRHRKRNVIAFSEERKRELEVAARTLSLFHATRHPEYAIKEGIHPASELWMTAHKSTANPMDIALGLDRFVFCTQGYTLQNFGETSVEVPATLIDRPAALVSSIDIFKLVLIRTGRTIPTAIDTEEWAPVLQDYQRQIFAGTDFPELKADYVMTFFGSLEEYHHFAARHFYENTSEAAPEGEYAFLGELKIPGRIGKTECSLRF